METIQFVLEDVKFKFNNQLILKEWIKQIIENEKKELESITYIFCSDKSLHEINLTYLNHDTYTDIITFELSDEMIHSDIFISIDRVKENAQKFNTSFQNELYRVIIHGVLHLCGYEDNTKANKKIMKLKEDEALQLFLEMK